MLPFLSAIAPIVGGALGLFGSERSNRANIDNSQMTSAFNAAEAEKHREWSAGQAERQMDYQTKMSNTSWQRGVKDMQAAGLNPMLAFSQGGASVPGGAMGASSAASGVNPPPMENSLGRGLSSAGEASRAIQEYQAREQERAIKAPVEKIAEVAGKGVDAVKDVVKPLSEKVSEIVQAVEDKVKDGSLTGAVTDRVERIIEGAKSLATDVGERIMSGSQKALSAGTSSAGEAVRRQESALGRRIHGEKGVKLPPSKGKVPREAQGRIRRHEWKFNYTPGR